MRNMNCKFEKVSFEQFEKDWIDTFGVKKNIREIYDNIKLPKRATAKSSGYDFFAPVTFAMKPHQTIKIPTGIKVKLGDENWLMIMPRSGLGFKFRIQLDNTVGNIDSDYYNNKSNEGHIFVKMTNDSICEDDNKKKICVVGINEAMCQGVICKFDITCDDDADGERIGGLGSTTK